MREYDEEMLDGKAFDDPVSVRDANHTIHNSHKERQFYASDLLRDLESRCKILREKIPTGWRAIPCGSIRRQMRIVHDLDVVLFMEDESKTESVKGFFLAC
jgi:DNA polymerase/3'-5' exonuclease PolX